MERLETKNLVLRKATENDMEAIWKNIWQDESIPKYQNLGYGKEILQALMKLAFEEFGGEKFVYACMHENERSRNVCQRFGFCYSHSQKEVRQWDGAQFVNDFYYLMREEYENGRKDTEN